MAARVGIAPGTILNILNAFRGSTFTVPAFYLNLHTIIPGAAGTTGLSTGDGSRQPLVFSPAAGGALAQTGNPPYWLNSGTMGEVVSHWSAWTGLVGTFIMSGEFDVPVEWDTGDTLQLSTLTLPLGPVAAS